MFPKCGKIKVSNSKHCNSLQFKNITTHKSQKWLIFQNINTSKFKYLKAHNMIPLSSLKRLLAHLSKHLLPDNKLSDHRHT